MVVGLEDDGNDENMSLNPTQRLLKMKLKGKFANVHIRRVCCMDSEGKWFGFSASNLAEFQNDEEGP